MSNDSRITLSACVFSSGKGEIVKKKKNSFIHISWVTALSCPGSLLAKCSKTKYYNKHTDSYVWPDVERELLLMLHLGLIQKSPFAVWFVPPDHRVTNRSSAMIVHIHNTRKTANGMRWLGLWCQCEYGVLKLNRENGVLKFLHLGALFSVTKNMYSRPKYRRKKKFIYKCEWGLSLAKECMGLLRGTVTEIHSWSLPVFLNVDGITLAQSIYFVTSHWFIFCWPILH